MATIFRDLNANEIKVEHNGTVITVPTGVNGYNIFTKNTADDGYISNIMLDLIIVTQIIDSNTARTLCMNLEEAREVAKVLARM